MRALSVRLITTFREWSLRRRIAGVLAAVLVNVLLLLMLLTMAPDVAGLKTDKGGLLTFDVAPPAPPATEKSVEQPTVHAEARAAPPPVPPPTPVTPPVDLGLIQLSHDELSQVDNAMRAPPIQRPSRSASSDTQSANSSDTPAAPGKGPHGETLYYAQWYREPTQAELAAYRPTLEPPAGSYATIACRTVARYHVDDCVAVDEAPSGYGLSRSVLNAAWQFLVLPPRIGGKVMVGEWVRIRITYRDAPSKGDGR